MPALFYIPVNADKVQRLTPAPSQNTLLTDNDTERRLCTRRDRGPTGDVTACTQILGQGSRHRLFKLGQKSQSVHDCLSLQNLFFCRNVQPASRHSRSDGDVYSRLQRAAGVKSRRLVGRDRKSTRLNSSHVAISYAVF